MVVLWATEVGRLGTFTRGRRHGDWPLILLKSSSKGTEGTETVGFSTNPARKGASFSFAKAGAKVMSSANNSLSITKVTRSTKSAPIANESGPGNALLNEPGNMSPSTARGNGSAHARPAHTDVAGSGKSGSRHSLVEQAYHDLKGRILSNEYPPAFQATETEIAHRLAMSRTPVHEALLRLQSDGLVELLPRHGVRVLPIYPADLREIYELLCCLESTAAELMANRRLPADAPEFAEMEAANVAMDEALARDDLDTFAEMDDRFHRLLVRYSGNERLMRFVFSISDQQHRARRLTLRLRPKPTQSSAEHRTTLEAIRRGDARAAHELHKAHRVRGMNLILGLIEHYRLGHL